MDVRAVADLRNLIRSERIRQGLSQTELGNRCDIHRNSVYAFEKGRNDMLCGDVLKMLSALDVDLHLHLRPQIGLKTAAHSTQREG